jgi:hypothetical protein
LLLLHLVEPSIFKLRACKINVVIHYGDRNWVDICTNCVGL